MKSFKLAKILSHLLTYSLYAMYVACNAYVTSASMFSSMNSPDQGTQECPYLQDFVWRTMYLTEHNYRNHVL